MAGAVYAALRLQADLELPALAIPRVGALFQLLGLYLGELVQPWPLTVGREISELALSPADWVAAAVAYALLLWGLWRGRGLALAGLALAFGAFAPTVFAMSAHGQLGERFLYLPLAGLAVVVAAAIPRDSSPRKLLAALVLVAVPSVLAISLRLPDWGNSETLWTAEVERCPTAYSHGVLANVLDRKETLTGALDAAPHYRAALSGPAPRLSLCGDAIRLAPRLPGSAAALSLVEFAYEAGCTPTDGSEGIRALVLAKAGRWPEAEALASDLSGSDDESVLLRVRLISAAAARAGGRTPELERIAAEFTRRGISREDFETMLSVLLATYPGYSP